MKRLIAAAAAVLLASEAQAISRYDASSMACAAVQAAIEAEGAAILTYPSGSILGLPIYDRYVRGREFCASNEVMRQTGVPTLDERYCPVMKCVESDIFVDG